MTHTTVTIIKRITDKLCVTCKPLEKSRKTTVTTTQTTSPSSTTAEPTTTTQTSALLTATAAAEASYQGSPFQPTPFGIPSVQSTVYVTTSNVVSETATATTTGLVNSDTAPPPGHSSGNMPMILGITGALVFVISVGFLLWVKYCRPFMTRGTRSSFSVGERSTDRIVSSRRPSARDPMFMESDAGFNEKTINRSSSPTLDIHDDILHSSPWSSLWNMSLPDSAQGHPPRISQQVLATDQAAVRNSTVSNLERIIPPHHQLRIASMHVDANSEEMRNWAYASRTIGV